MNRKAPAFEKSRDVEDVQHLRLMTLLGELVRDRGIMRAAGELNVDHRTLGTALETGKLSRRMRGALENALLKGGGSPAARQQERNDQLAGRVDVVEKAVEALGRETGQGLAAVQDDVQALRNDHARDLQSVESRLARIEGREGSGESAEQEEGEGESGSVGGSPQQVSRRRREFPELATLEPADDDEDVFGDAWALIREWRKLKESHANKGKGLEWMREGERLLAVELALLEEHGLTLPPETYPLRGLDRGSQVNWRRKALVDTRRRLARQELLHRLWRVLSLRMWRE